MLHCARDVHHCGWVDSTPSDQVETAEPSSRFSRRRILSLAGSGVALVGLGALGVELVDHGVLPGQSVLNEIDGACQLDVPQHSYGPVGQEITGSFYSRRRHSDVGYSIGLPADFRPGDTVPLIVFLHGEFSSHRESLGIASTPARAVALKIPGRPLAPLAIATVDGGSHYWHKFNNDDPMAMVVDEFLPKCRRLGLGTTTGSVGAMGLSMGGYGSLIFGEHHPDIFSAVAALSPAIWTSYSQAHGANARAYSSAANFAQFDAVTHASKLAHSATFLASGFHDPFYPGAQAFRNALAPETRARIIFAKGCHGGSFYTLHMPAALSFMSQHLTA
jgi:enterochelin esterase-like enzyme